MSKKLKSDVEITMENANKAHAELGYRTLLVHAQYVSKNMSAGNIEEVVIDLLTSLMHLDQEYGANFDDMLRMAKDRFETEKLSLSEGVVQPAERNKYDSRATS